MAVGSGGCRAACLLPAWEAMGAGARGLFGSGKAIWRPLLTGQHWAVQRWMPALIPRGGRLSTGWDVPRAPGTPAGHVRALARDGQWSGQREAAGRTRSHRLLRVSICPSPQHHRVPLRRARRSSTCHRAGASKTPRVRRGQGMGRDVALKPQRAFVGNTRTLPCVQRPPHHVGDHVPCATGDGHSPCAVRDGWDGETPPPQPRTRSTGLAAPWWQQQRSRTPPGPGDGSMPLTITGSRGVLIWDPLAGTPAQTVTLRRHSQPR